MSTELSKRPTTTTEIPVQKKDTTETQLFDPFFDKTLVDPFFDRSQGTYLDPFGRQVVDPLYMVNELMRRVDPTMRPSGWGDMMTTRPFQNLAEQQTRNLGPLTNIIKADIAETTDCYCLDAGTMHHLPTVSISYF